MSLKYLPSRQNELACIRRLRVQYGFCFCSHRCVATEMCCCCCCLPPPLVRARTNCSCLFRTCSLFCVSSNRRKCSPRSHFALNFFYPLPVSVFMSKGHTMSPPPPFYVFSLRLFPLPPPFFPFVAELRRCVAVQRNIKRKKKKRKLLERRSMLNKSQVKHTFSSPPVCLNSWERRREVLSTLLRFWCRTVPLLLLNAAFLLVELATRFLFLYFFFSPPPIYYSHYFRYRTLPLSHAQIACHSSYAARPL